MSQEIGAVWQKFYEQGFYASIPNKSSDKSIGLYTNYASDVNGEYDLLVCCETSAGDDLPQGVEAAAIPAGKYAKFIVHGNMEKVAEAWGEIWQTNLDRKYSCDFEEYQCDDMTNMEVNIYISLN
jgi:predicted transcriptional regulator YdeE